MRPVLVAAQFGIMAVLGGSIVPATQAQYGGYGGGYAAYPGYGQTQRGLSIQVGVGSGGYPAAVPTYGGYSGGTVTGGGYPPGYPGVGASYGGGIVGGGYAQGYPGPGVGYANYPSPAQRQGYREGRLYYETGIAPDRPLSPAEARGFVAGERRAAATPWQHDPARQQGYREGEVYWETGLTPNRPLSPAEAQGFRAGERRAASGYGGYPY